MNRAGSLMELLVVMATVAVLAGLLTPATVRAYARIKHRLHNMELDHYRRTMRWIGEPDPRMIDTNTGKDRWMVRHPDPRFSNILIAIEPW